MIEHPRQSRCDLLCLFTLLLFGLVIKGWLITRTEVLARDGIGFIELAQCLQTEPWGHTIRRAHQHPLYPMHVLGMAALYERFLDRPMTNLDWQTCAHLANAWISLAMIIPAFLIGKRWFGAWIAWGALMMYQALPVPAQVTADALSEGTFLFCSMVGLWAFLNGLNDKGWGWFLLSGFMGGLAFLARPEGAILPISACLLMMGLKLRNLWDVRWPRLVGLGAVFCIAVLIAVGPYWLTIGGIGKKTTFTEMLNAHVSLSGTLWASRFQPGVDGYDWSDITPWFITWQVIKETTKGFHYVLWLPALLGIAAWVRSDKSIAEKQIGYSVLTIMGINLIILWWLAYKAHYISERHTILLVLLGCFWSMKGLTVLGDYLAQSWRRWVWPAERWTMVCVVLLVALGLFSSLKPRHTHRLGHREFGQWLGQQLKPSDRLVDPYRYMTFYAGWRTYYHNQLLNMDPNSPAYVVAEVDEKDQTRKAVLGDLPQRSKVIKVWPEAGRPRIILYRFEPSLIQTGLQTPSPQ